MSEPTTPPIDPDEALLADLRAAGRALDPVPPLLLDAARGAYGWRNVDAELAALTFDSVMQEEVVGFRSGGQPRLLTFEGAELTVEVEVHEERARRRLVGQLVPPGPGRVEVRHEAGSVDAVVDDLGRFAAEAVAPGPVSLRCHVGGRVVDTDWTVV